MDKSEINNEIYNSYGERWYTAFDDPVALLRAENGAKIPWILGQIRQIGAPGHKVLDVGCGGGFFTNDFSRRGFEVTGVDISKESLRVAQEHDITHRVDYQVADAYHLPFLDQTFDIVCTLDFLEHVQRPGTIIKECSRVLKKDGLFFFHTFNRNRVTEMVMIRFLEKYIKNTAKNMHLLELFIKPEEMVKYCQEAGLQLLHMEGLRPVLTSLSVRSLMKGEISPQTRFKPTSTKCFSYIGVAKKE